MESATLILSVRERTVYGTTGAPAQAAGEEVATLLENPEQCNVHGMKTPWTLTLLLLAWPMYAQDAPGAKVYKDQFVQLHSRTTSILHRVEELMRGEPTDRDILNLEEETHALHKLVNHLGEDSLQSYVDEIKKGHSANRAFLFVSSGCTEMGFVLDVLNSFMDTKDRDFLGLAKRGEDITVSAQEML